MKLSDLGNLVKQRYQQYADRDPVEVGQAVINKFPTYRQKVTDFSEQIMSGAGDAYFKMAEPVAGQPVRNFAKALTRLKKKSTD